VKSNCIAVLIILTTGSGAAAADSIETPPVGTRWPVLGTSKFGSSSFGIDAASGFNVSAVVAGGEGSITCQSPIPMGGASLCTISPQNGYSLVSFTDNQSDRLTAVTSNSYLIAGITADHDLTATFAPLAPVPGICGSSNDGTLTTPPNTNLCTSGTASAVSGSGPWSWTCAGLNGGTTSSCSATTGDRIKILRTNTSHPTLQDAYNQATDGERISAQAITLAGDLYCNKNIKIKLLGGKDSNHLASTGFTTVRGTMIIRNGRVDVSRFILR
jgi:hypothetical protein